MRLSDLLSKPPKRDFLQVDGFLISKKCNVGQQIKLDIGRIALNYFCVNCDDIRTFCSCGSLSCICVNEHMISIDSVLTCNCGYSVQLWFLVECSNDISFQAPKVRIIRRGERLTNQVYRNDARYGDLTPLLDKAEFAYWNELGAGSIVYLRKIYEKITVQMANAVGISYQKYEGGNPKNFSSLLQEVDEQCHIIPSEFSSNRYKLFRELSNVVHGDYDEQAGLDKFEALHRLIIGILENIRNKKELQDSLNALGWNTSEENES